MIVLDNAEHAALQKFSDGGVHKGWDDAAVDRLACRGLLIRQETVREQLFNVQLWNSMKLVSQVETANKNREILRDRSQNHHYQISNRGRRALQYPRISSF